MTWKYYRHKHHSSISAFICVNTSKHSFTIFLKIEQFLKSDHLNHPFVYETICGSYHIFQRVKMVLHVNIARKLHYLILKSAFSFMNCLHIFNLRIKRDKFKCVLKHLVDTMDLNSIHICGIEGMG